jgi:hypothetical protein
VWLDLELSEIIRRLGDRHRGWRLVRLSMIGLAFPWPPQHSGNDSLPDEQVEQLPYSRHQAVTTGHEAVTTGGGSHRKVSLSLHKPG